MTKYEQALQEAADKGLEIIEDFAFDSDAGGILVGNTVLMSRRLQAYREKACVLAEEIAHHDLNVGDILDQSDAGASQQEHRARMRAFDRLVGLSGIVSCFKAGDRSLWEMAERLEVTEEFLQGALEAYRLRYGDGVALDGCWISFEPYFVVAESLNKEF